MRGVGGKAERRGEDEQEQEGRGGGEKKKREEENKAEEKKDEKDGGTADQEGREGCGARANGCWAAAHPDGRRSSVRVLIMSSRTDVWLDDEYDGRRTCTTSLPQ